jgi:hypothetical protein
MVNVIRGWAGRDNAILTEPASSQVYALLDGVVRSYKPPSVTMNILSLFFIFSTLRSKTDGKIFHFLEPSIFASSVLSVSKTDDLEKTLTLDIGILWGNLFCVIRYKTGKGIDCDTS